MADEARLVPPTEATAILRALKPYEEAEAKKRQQAGQKAGGRGKKKHGAKKAPSKGNARTRAAQATGYSASTLANVAAVEAAAQERQRLGERSANNSARL